MNCKKWYFNARTCVLECKRLRREDNKQPNMKQIQDRPTGCSIHKLFLLLETPLKLVSTYQKIRHTDRQKDNCIFAVTRKSFCICVCWHLVIELVLPSLCARRGNILFMGIKTATFRKSHMVSMTFIKVLMEIKG